MVTVGESRRRVPPRLWVRVVLGQTMLQVTAALIGMLGFAAALFLPHGGPEDPPLAIVGFIVLLGYMPVIAVAMFRAHRILHMLRRGRLSADGRTLDDPTGEQAASELAKMPGSPSIDEQNRIIVPTLVVEPLVLLPLAGLAGIVATFVAA